MENQKTAQVLIFWYVAQLPTSGRIRIPAIFEGTSEIQRMLTGRAGPGLDVR